MANEESSFDGFFDRMSWKVLIIIGILVVGILFFTMRNQTTTEGVEDNRSVNESQEETFERYASVNESRGTSDTEGSEVVADVSIAEYGLSPTRVNIKVGESVMWDNTNDFPVYIKFDGIEEPLDIAGGETGEMRFRGMSNYVVRKESDDSIVGKGFVYVE